MKKNNIIILAWFIWLSCGLQSWAEDDLTDSGDENVLPEVVVRAPAISLEQKIYMEKFTNVGEALTQISGISGVRKSASMVEPVIRGLGSERVQTQVGHLPLYG